MTTFDPNFDWLVRTDGYRWDYPADRFRSDPVLVPADSLEETYAPLRERTGLFRTFADLEPTENAVLAFADGHGLLGAGPDAEAGRGETLSRWQQEIWHARVVVRVWDWVRDVDDDARNENLEVDRAAARVVCKPPAAGLSVMDAIALSGIAQDTSVGLDDVDPGLRAAVERGSARAAGLAFVLARVNERLAGLVTPRLTHDAAEGRPTLTLAPSGLLGAVWLQIAAAVGEGRSHRRCRECGLWYEVAGGAARTDRAFCSDACRLRAHRRRQSHARRLCAEGKSLREVARAVGSDVKTVKGWVEGQKG